MILGLVFGFFFGTFFGAWLYWTREVAERRKIAAANEPWPRWTNSAWNRLHGRRDRW